MSKMSIGFMKTHFCIKPETLFDKCTHAEVLMTYYEINNLWNKYIHSNTFIQIVLPT